MGPSSKRAGVLIVASFTISIGACAPHAAVTRYDLDAVLSKVSSRYRDRHWECDFQQLRTSNNTIQRVGHGRLYVIPGHARLDFFSETPMYGHPPDHPPATERIVVMRPEEVDILDFMSRQMMSRAQSFPPAFALMSSVRSVRVVIDQARSNKTEITLIVSGNRTATLRVSAVDYRIETITVGSDALELGAEWDRRDMVTEDLFVKPEFALFGITSPFVGDVFPLAAP